MAHPGSASRLLVACVVAGIGGWALWPSLSEVVQKWADDPQYSHGFLVPVFSAYLVWRRRAELADVALEPSWWGLPLLGVGILAHLLGAYFYFDWISAAAIVPVVAGAVAACAGVRVLYWVWPAVGFLVFMLPLPFQVEIALAHPLRQVATLASTYALQTFGFQAVAEGNIIIMDQARIGVVDACNGLGMLVTFFALTTGVAMLVDRCWADKVVLVLSAIPIALLSNIIRVTATGAVAELAGSEIADLVFHDLAGWVMMPLALGMLWAETLLLTQVLLEPTPDDQSGYGIALDHLGREPVSAAGAVSGSPAAR